MREYFDVCDDQGRPTGEIVAREEAHAKGICHRTAHVWIVREDGIRLNLLLQKRSQEKDSYPGFYDTSSAGHIPAGSEPLPSALRELEEELGLKAEPDDLVFIGNFHIEYEEVFHDKLFHDNEVAWVYVYQGEVREEDLVLQREEIESVKWFSLEEVLDGLEREGLEIADEDEERFCVPMESIRLLHRYIQEKQN